MGALQRAVLLTLATTLFLIVILTYYWSNQNAKMQNTGSHLPQYLEFLKEDKNTEETTKMTYTQEQFTNVIAKPCIHAKNSLVFVKVSTAGSTTMRNVLYHFASRKNLSVLVPADNNIRLGWPLNLQPEFYLPSKSGPVHFNTRHQIYTHDLLGKIMAPDKVTTVNLRNPMTRALAMLRKWGKKFIESLGITAVDFLKEPEKYDEMWKNRSMKYMAARCQRQSLFQHELCHYSGYPVGYPPGSSDKTGDMDYFSNWLSTLNDRFDLLIILKHLDVSFILLKRIMCWDLKDFLYVNLNTHPPINDPILDEETIEIVRNFNKLDIKLYEYANTTLWRKVANQGPSFWKELKQFENMIQKTRDFCVNKGSRSQLYMPASEWNEAFYMTSEDCRRLQRRVSHSGMRRIYHNTYPKTEPTVTSSYLKNHPFQYCLK